MKRTKQFPRFLALFGSTTIPRAAALLLVIGAVSAHAATLWWDGASSTANSASDNTTTSAQNWLSGGNWDNGSTSGTLSSWTSGDSAIFGGSAASQTIAAGSFTVGNLTFGGGAQGTGTSGTAYTITGGTITLSGGTLTVNTPTAINSILAGTSGLTSAGSATLTLGGSNTYSGTTAITAGTTKITAGGYTPYRYYRFTVSANQGDGYNQIGELHYYYNGVWTAATNGSASGGGTGEQYWGNANDNKGTSSSFTKYGVSGVPYYITYDFGSPTVFNSYNWSTANDSTPARNPKRWIVAGSNDNTNWFTLDDRSGADQAGPSTTYTWSGTSTSYAAVTNGTNDGATNAYPIAGTGNLPTASPVQITSGATLDLNGTNQVSASLAGGGSVINSASSKSLTFTLSSTSGSTTYSGVISDSGSANAVSLSKLGASTQIIGGTNTYYGTTTVNGGILQLTTGGQIGPHTLSVTGGTFDLNGQNQTISLLTGTAGSIANSSTANSTLTVSVGASAAGTFAGSLTTPSTGNLNLIFNSTSGGSASATSLSNTANTFKGSITVNGTGYMDGGDGHGLLGINTDGSLGDPSNPITLNNGGAICNMYNPSSGGGWPNHAVFTLAATRTITLTGIGGVIRVGYAPDSCTINSTITGSGGLDKTDGGALTLGGSTSNTYTGDTTLGDTGKLVLAKTGGAIAIAGNINLSSSAWNGAASGVVLNGDEQIADTSVITWTTTALGGGTQQDSFFRPYGHTETIGGLVSTGNGGKAVIENRGFNDTTTLGTGTVIINTTGTNSYTYNGNIRDTDLGSGGGNIAIVKTGTGTQTFTGSIVYTGATTVNGGTLQINTSLGSSAVTVTNTGTLAGTGTIGSSITVQSGGTLSPGVAGSGTLTASGTVTIGSGGTLTGTGTLNGAVTIASGGTLSGTGTVTGTLNVQAGGSLAPGSTAIGNLTTGSSVTLAGNTTMRINKSGTTLTCDSVSGFSSITYGGNLTIVASGDTLGVGDGFQLFVPGTGGTYGGSFANIYGLPTLAAGLTWETTTLVGTGRITVVNYVSTPSFNPAAGGYIGAQTVSITSDTGSTIYYTTDGSTPTIFSPSGTSPITGIVIPTDSTVTLQAYASHSGQADSPVASAVYHTVTTATWNVDADGNWSDTTKWLNSVSPNGSGAPVAITYSRTANGVITLDATRTAGSLTFGNANGYTWTLASSGGSLLTLDTPSGTPSITTQDVDTTISAVIAGSEGFSKSGPGTLILSGANIYTGNTAVDGGVLSVSNFASNGNSSNIGAGTTMSFNGGTLRYTGTNVPGNNFNRNITLNAGGGTLDFGGTSFWFTTGVISGPGPLTKTGTGQLIMQDSNIYDGITYLNGGEIQLRNLNALGSTVGRTIVANGARLCAGGGLTGTVTEPLELNGNGGGSGALQSNDGGTNVTYAGAITLASDSGVGSNTGIDFTISSQIGGSGGLVKLSSDAVTIAGSAGNTYAGTTTLGSTGKLILAKTGGAVAIPGNINISTTAWNGNSMGIVLAADEQIADTAVISWTGGDYGGTLRLNGHTETIGGLNSTASGLDPEIENRGYGDTTSYSNATLVINTVGSNVYSYNGGIRDMDQGTGSGVILLVKAGTGTQILNGGMSSAGTTTVNGGTLEIDCVSSAVATTVNSGATLRGTGGVTGALTVNAGGTIAPGNGAGTFTAGPTTINGTYACDLDGANADRLTVTGSLDLTAATLAINVINTPTADSYVIASYTSTLTNTFSMVNDMPTGYSLQYDAANSQIKLVKSGYSSWAALHGLSGNPTADYDGDGLPDVVEYVLGTNPTTANSGGPSASLADGNLVFTFQRDHASLTSDISLSVEVSTDLANWPGVYHVGADTASSDAGITVTDNGTYDTVTLTVPQAPDAQKFARLRVIVTP